MTFERTRNFGLVREIITNPKIWPNVVDDFSPPPERFTPLEAEGVWYILARDEAGKPLGVICFAQRSAIIFEIHPLLLPECWWSFDIASGSSQARLATLGAIDWMWRNSPAESILGVVPVFEHRTKLRFPARLGMEHYGTHPKSFQRDGKLYDQVLVGVSRPNELRT